jgi:hypothetical protein
MASDQVTMPWLQPLSVLYLTLILLLARPPEALGESTDAGRAMQSSADARGQTVATFAGGRITLDDMQTVLDHRPRSVRAAAVSAAGRQRLLSELLDYDLLVLEAERRGYRNRPATAQAARRAAVDALLAATRRQGAVPDANSPEIAAYFAEHSGNFQRPALRRAMHIQVAGEAEARALLASLAGATREQFASVARERSLDVRTRRQGGELGYCDEKGQAWERAADEGCPAPIARAMFALSKNDELAPQPVAHDSAFSVVMLTAQMPAKIPTLDRVRAKIVELLAERARAQRLDALMARLRAERSIEVHPELLDAVVLPAALPQDMPAGFPAAPVDPRVPPKEVEPDGI